MKLRLFFLMLIIFFNFKSLAYSLEDYSKDLEILSKEQKELFLTSANKLKCPTCTGLSILGSETIFSMQIRKKVLDLVREEKNEKEIASFFENHYGPWIFRTPPKEGLHIAVWIVPGLLLFVLFLILVRLLSRNKNKIKNQKKDIEALFEKELEEFKIKKA